MELQQYLNLIIRFLKQMVGLQHICGEHREDINPYFHIFGDTTIMR